MRIEYPDWYDGDESEQSLVESNGYLCGVVVHLPEASHELMFYDPVRLRRDVEATLAYECYFDEGRIVVLPTVTEADIERAVSCMFAPRG